ncbi:MAG: hypothetical protein IIC46_06920 [Planctomycetes bacterium]|nr:hypothetical protein [Planctomycetota bacterium]
MRIEPTMRFLGVKSDAGPAAMLGLGLEPSDVQAVESALDRQLRKVNIHPDSGSDDADVVRTTLRKAAETLTKSLGEGPPRAVASGGLPAVASVPPPPTMPRQLTPGWTPRGGPVHAQLELTSFDRQVMAVLVGCGGWNITSRSKLVALAEAHGLTVQGLVTVVTGLSEYAKSGGPGLGVAALTSGAARVPYLPAAPTSPAQPAAHPDAGAPALPEHDPAWSRIKLSVLFGVLTLVVGILALRFALSGPAKPSSTGTDDAAVSAGPAGSDPSSSDTSQPPSPRSAAPRLAMFNPLPTFRGDSLPVAAVDAAAECADLPDQLDLLARRITIADEPSQAVYRHFNVIIETVAAGWMFIDDATRDALVRAIFEVLYAAGDSPSVTDRLLATLTASTGAPTDPVEIWRGMWKVSMLQTITARADLAPAVIQRARAQLDVALRHAAIDSTDSRAAASAWLDRIAIALVDVMEYQVVIYDLWECWLGAQRYLGVDERYNVSLMRAVDAIMAGSTDLSQPGPSVNVLGRLLSAANFQSSPAVRGQVRSLLADLQRIDADDLWVLTSLLAQYDSVSWFGEDLVVPYDAGWMFRRRMADRIMDRWPQAASTVAALDTLPRGLAVDAQLGFRWLAVVQQVLDRPLTSHPQRLMDELLLASWLNEAALRLVADELVMARDLIERVETGVHSDAIPTMRGGSSGSIRPGQPIGNDAVWAVAYEEAGSNLNDRLRSLDVLRRNAGTDLGPIDAEQFVAVVYRGSPRELRDLAGNILVERFQTGPNVALQMLDQFADAPANSSLSETIGRLTGRLLPTQRAASWLAEARLALVEHALSLRRGGDSPIEIRSQLLTESYLNQEAALRGQLRPTLRARSSQQAAQRLAEAYRDRAIAVIVSDPVPGDLPALTRRDATRRRLAEGPIQRFVAAQLAVLDLLAYITTAEQPDQALAGRELLTAAAQRRARLGHVLAQSADVERTILAFWRVRIAIEPLGTSRQ